MVAGALARPLVRGLVRPLVGRKGVGGNPLLLLSDRIVAENHTINTDIGTLSVANLNGLSVSSYSIVLDADNKFAISSDRLQNDQAFNYETATSHNVTVRATLSDASTVDRIFTIVITNVFETGDLAALTLAADDIESGSAAATVVGAIVGKTSGSSLSMTDDAGGRFALSGTNVVAGLVATDYDVATGHDITIRETHADSSNSPRDSVIGVTVTPEALDPITSVVWTTIATDTTPEFSLNLPAEAVAGDVVAAVYATSGAVTDPTTWTEYFRYVLTAQDIIDDTIYANGLTPLAEGDWDFVFRLERGAAVSAWTAVVDVQINFAPNLSSTVPSDGATGFSISANLTATFDRPIQFGTGTINIYATTGDVLLESFNVATEVGTGAGQVSISGAVLTINPTSSLAGTTDYYVQIDAGAIENLNDIAFAGISDETTWNFTSGSSLSPFSITGNNYYTDTADLTTYTFAVSGLTAPTGSDTRHLIIAVGGCRGSNVGITSVTSSVTGSTVAATAVIYTGTAIGSSFVPSGFYVVAAASGTSGNIVVVTSAAPQGVSIYVWQMINGNATPVDTAADITPSSGAVNLDADIASGDIGLGATVVRDDTPETLSWTGLTAIGTKQAVFTDCYFFAASGTTTGTPRTITVTQTGTVQNMSGVVAVFRAA